MLDPSDKGSESESMSSNKSQEIKKTCADCGTSKTPLWRGGPAGPKSLCNACGIRSRKKKRDMLGLSKPMDKKPRSKSSNNHHHNNNNTNNNNHKFLKQRLMVFDRDVLVKRSSVEKQRSRKQLGEEEQAAFLLMALSCGSVYA